MGGSPHAIQKHISKSASSNFEAALVAPSKGTTKNSDTKVSILLPAVQDRRLRKILTMIESHPSHRIDDLALQCNLSGSRLQHLFKEHTGLGLGQLLTEQRMQQAAEFLVHTDMSIKEIATTIGYEHASSFTRAFERRFRLAPKCFRQEQIPQEMSAKDR